MVKFVKVIGLKSFHKKQVSTLFGFHIEGMGCYHIVVFPQVMPCLFQEGCLHDLAKHDKVHFNLVSTSNVWNRWGPVHK